MGLVSLIMEIFGIDESDTEDNGLIDSEQLKYVCPNKINCLKETGNCYNGTWGKCSNYTNL
jgi:hypothetical protein